VARLAPGRASEGLSGKAMACDQANDSKDGWAGPNSRTVQQYFSGKGPETEADTAVAVLALTCLSDYFLVSTFSMYLIEQRYPLTRPGVAL
jgi:hypothetical protein